MVVTTIKCSPMAVSEIAVAIGEAVPFLIDAHMSFDDHHLTACGCQLRESIKRFVASLIESRGIERPVIKPRHKESKRQPRYKQWTVPDQIKALVEVRWIDPQYGQLLIQSLKCCHRLAHCELLSEQEVARSLADTCEIMCIPRFMEPPRRLQEGGAA